MEYTKLGRTGLKVSRLGLGTNTFGSSAVQETASAIMDTAFDAGVDFIDTADVYCNWVEGNTGGESETMIGNWLKDKPRHQVIVATKVKGRMWEGPNGEGLSRHHIIQAAEDSLRRLQTDYIDLYQAHSPDPDTPLEETLAAFDALVQSGKVRYIGASNYPAWLTAKALWVSDVNNLARYESVQPHYSLLFRAEFERELELLCLDQGLANIPYFPLASGFLTGKYSRENKSPDTARINSRVIKRLIDDDRAYAVLDALAEIAAAHDATVLHVALAWLLARPSVTVPIVGARVPEQVTGVVGAVAVKLADAEVERLNELSAGF